MSTPDIPVSTAATGIRQVPSPMERAAQRRRFIRMCLFLLAVILGIGGLVWVRDASRQELAYRAERREMIKQQCAIINRQIEERQNRIEALSVKEKVQLQYAGELRNSYIGNDGSAQIAQAEVLAEEQHRLSVEIARLERELAKLNAESASLKPD